MIVCKIYPFVLSASFSLSNCLIWPILSHTNWFSLSSKNKSFWFSLSWMKRLYRKLFLNHGVWNCTQLVINLYWTFLIIKHVTRIKFNNLLYFQFSFFTFLLFLGNQTYLISIFSIFLFTFLQFLSNQINLHFYFLNFLFYFLEISW